MVVYTHVANSKISTSMQRQEGTFSPIQISFPSFNLDSDGLIDECRSLIEPAE